MNNFLDLLLDFCITIHLQMSPKSPVVSIFGVLTKLDKNFYCLRETEFNIKKERFDTHTVHLFKVEHIIEVRSNCYDFNTGDKKIPDLWKKYNWTTPDDV